MPAIAPGCHELRIVDEGRRWRLVYRIDEDAILLVDFFAKSTRATLQSVIERCRRRLRSYDENP